MYVSLPVSWPYLSYIYSWLIIPYISWKVEQTQVESIASGVIDVNMPSDKVMTIPDDVGSKPTAITETTDNKVC